MATVSAAIERKKARTPRRSALAGAVDMFKGSGMIASVEEATVTGRGRPSRKEHNSPAKMTSADHEERHRGTRTESTISRRTLSVVSDFFCSEAWRALATTRCEKTATASCLK